MDAAQADAAAYSSYYAPNKITITSCNGKGQCSYVYTNSNGNTRTGDDLIVGIHYACPVPSVNPDVHYALNQLAYVCERAAQAKLSIALTGGDSMEPRTATSASVLPFIATVVDLKTGQPPTAPVAVKISLKVDPTSGGHDHGDSTRPRGGIAEIENCSSDATWCSHLTDGSGQVVFNFNAPEASGKHTITATCDGCSNTASKAVDVKVEGLATISDSVYYALIEDGSTKVIGTTEEHASNHYIASAAQLKLWELGEDFYSFQIRNSVPTPTLLHLNDASLKWGGKFDIKGRWRGDHQEHMRGTVIDVRANSSPGAIPPGLFEHYIDIAANLGIDAHLEYIGHPVKQHFHMRLLNRRE